MNSKSVNLRAALSERPQQVIIGEIGDDKALEEIVAAMSRDPIIDLNYKGFRVSVVADRSKAGLSANFPLVSIRKILEAQQGPFMVIEDSKEMDLTGEKGDCCLG